MPHYSYEKTFAPGKTRDTEEELEMPCHWGILCDTVIAWRHGTGRRCHVHIDDGLHQIWPVNPEQSYAFDGYALEIRDEYELLPSVRKIYLRGWNEGVYEHTVALTFTVRLPSEETRTEDLLSRLVSIWERLTGVSTGPKKIKGRKVEEAPT